MEQIAAGGRARGGLLLTLVVAAVFGSAVCQAMVVAPHAVFIDHYTRSGVLYLQNPGDMPEEFSIKLEFGYPVSDSLGGVYVELIEEPGEGMPSAAGWVRALPARAVVQPGERQAVRLLAQPPRNLPDGEYWSRIIVESRATNPPVAVTDDERVQVGLTMQMRTITSLTYRKGRVSTAAQIESFAGRVQGGQLVVDLRFKRTGNAAFLGNLEFSLTDPRGGTAGEWHQVIAVYRDLYRRLVYPVENLAPGQYRLHLRLSTDREDIPPRNVLPAEPVEQVLNLTVRGGGD